MRFPFITTLTLGLSTGFAFAEVAAVRPLAPGSLPKSSEALSAQKSVRDAAVADCVGMWDRGTHMTKQEWSRTGQRVQDRLQQLPTK